jgi:hypothetical protein
MIRQTGPNEASAVLRRWLAGCRRAPTILGVAMVLSVLGWSLMWASGLGLVSIVPVYAGGLLFLLGLALIPVSRMHRGAADRPAPDDGSDRRNQEGGSSGA